MFEIICIRAEEPISFCAAAEAAEAAVTTLQMVLDHIPIMFIAI